MNRSDYKYCPRCRSRLTSTTDAFECSNCGMIIYKNSAPTASMLIVKNDKVLLARRNVEPFKGEYDVVGGFLKYGEDPAAGVRREAEEETGLKVRIIKMLAVYMDTYGKGGKRTLNFYYVGDIVSGRMKAQDDVAALEWFPIDKPPQPAFRSQKKVFRDLLKWHRARNPGS